MKTTGERIKEIRLELGMSKTEFGKHFGTTGSLVNKWETNQVTPSEQRLKEISKLCGIKVVDLVSTNSIGERIKRIRLEHGDNLREFGERVAEQMGIPKDEAPADSIVHRWESGKNYPNKNRLKAIADLGGMTVSQLLNSNPLSDYSTDELIQELERRGISHETTNQ